MRVNNFILIKTKFEWNEIVVHLHNNIIFGSRLAVRACTYLYGRCESRKLYTS